MARYSVAALSQAAQLSGVPSGTTVNGYLGYWGAAAGCGFRLRRLVLGAISGAGQPTSQQVRIGIYRQTVAPAGTGLAAAVLGQAQEIWTPTDPTVGLIMTTAATIGTTGPTIAAQPLATPTFNVQSASETAWEFMDEIICTTGTANGIAFVNLAATLNAGVQISLGVEIEV